MSITVNSTSVNNYNGGEIIKYNEIPPITSPITDDKLLSIVRNTYGGNWRFTSKPVSWNSNKIASFDAVRDSTLYRFTYDDNTKILTSLASLNTNDGTLKTNSAPKQTTLIPVVFCLVLILIIIKL